MRSVKAAQWIITWCVYICTSCNVHCKKSFAKFRCGQRWRELNEVGVEKFLLPCRLVLRHRCQHRNLAHLDMAFFLQCTYICTVAKTCGFSEMYVADYKFSLTSNSRIDSSVWFFSRLFTLIYSSISGNPRVSPQWVTRPKLTGLGFSRQDERVKGSYQN
jgi:hypothetical protein